VVLKKLYKVCLLLLQALERWTEALEAFRRCDEVEQDPFAKIMSRTMQHTVVRSIHTVYAQFSRVNF
jgi:hypothetical protein